MYQDQRTFFLIALMFLLGSAAGSLQLAQTGPSRSSLDSLYEAFVRLKASPSDMHGLPRVMTTGETAKCGFPVSGLVRKNIKNFSPEQQNAINRLFERPVLHKSILSPSGHFRIHYDTTGSYKPNYDPLLSVTANVNRLAAIFDSAYAYEVGVLGFRPPPSDNMAGGDNAYDVYIISEPREGYGATNPETPLDSNRYLSFIDIDNDFLASEGRATSGLDAARVTAAHELHHAIQIGSYVYGEEVFFHELTSTAMEDFVFPLVGDYYKGTYLKNYFDNPSKNYFVNSSSSNEFNGYRIGFWNIFLRDKYGIGIIKRQWELFTKYPAVKSIEISLLEQHVSFRNALDEFGIWTYFTGYRAKPGSYFKDAKYFPIIKYMQQMNFSSGLFPMNLTTNPLSNLFISFLVPSSNRIDTLVVKLTDGDSERALRNPSAQLGITFELFQGQRDNTKKIINDFYSRFTSPVTGVIAESDFYNNNLAGGQEIVYSETDYAYPNPFSYKGEFSSIPISLPVSFNQLRKAEIKVYTVAMKLVYEDKADIMDDINNNTYYVKWNGLDNSGSKLQTGIYIYVTESGGNIKTGKILIKNE